MWESWILCCSSRNSLLGRGKRTRLREELRAYEEGEEGEAADEVAACCKMREGDCKALPIRELRLMIQSTSLKRS